VPQGSVLGPLLFVLFINDLPEKVNSTVKLYADDSKLIKVLTSEASTHELQTDINEITQWTRDWLIKLNAAKCKIMHLGRNNESHAYTIDDLSKNERIVLEESNCERDLGVYISSDLKWAKHVSEIAAKANKILGMLVRNFTSRDTTLWKHLYTGLVRPHLEFASAAWNSHLIGDIKTLEKVQERASRIPIDLKHLAYEERLKIWGITTLEERRKRGDLIQMYKVLHNIEDIRWHTGPIHTTATHLRAATNNPLRLHRQQFPSRDRNDFCHFVAVRHEFFLNRVVDDWNSLTKTQVLAPNTDRFKASLGPLAPNRLL